MEPPQKRRRLEEAHERTADSARVERGLNGAYSQASGANLVNTPSTSDLSTVNNSHMFSPHDFPPASETLNISEQQNAAIAIQGTNWNWNFQDTLPMPGPSSEASRGGGDRMQSGSSNHLQPYGFSPMAKYDWSDMSSTIHSWVPNDLISMGFDVNINGF